jgi:hypothetical protein
VTILTIVQDAATRVGITPLPSSAVGNTEANATLLVAFARDAGRDAMERVNWVGLDTAAKITGDSTTTLFTLPSDWNRFSPGDRSPHGAMVSSKWPLDPLSGPINTEELNALKALPGGVIRPVWRIIRGSLEIWPALATGEIVTFNYYSKNWIIAADGLTRLSDWATDTDVSLIEEDVVMKGAMWRWLAARGLDYAEEFRQFEVSLTRNAAQQMTERTVSTARSFAYGDASYPGTISYTPP